MKIKLFLFAISVLLTANKVKAQYQSNQIDYTTMRSQSDNLIIEREDGKKIRLVWPYRMNIKKKVEWKQLLEDFQIDFGKVADNIPDYKFYSISYNQKQNLVVNEVKGKETYTVNESDGMDYVKSNICILRGDKIKFLIEFNDYEELLDPSLKAEIEAAISHIKNKFYISAVSPERHYYSVSSASILPNPKRKYKFFIPVGARLGLLKDKPYIELRPGLGLIIDKQNYVALMWNVMTQYNQLRDITEYDSYVGITTGSMGPGLGSEFAIKVKSGISGNENNLFRAGINYRTRSGLQIGVEYFLPEPEARRESQGISFGFNLGIGF